MSISVRNNQTKTIPFGGGVYFNPGVTIISDPKHLEHLRKMEKPFKMYCKTVIKGRGVPIFQVEAGSLEVDEKPKKKGKKGPKDAPEKVSPFAEKTEDEALILTEGVLDVPSLELIIATETRESVIDKAKEILEDIKKLPEQNK